MNAAGVRRPGYRAWYWSPLRREDRSDPLRVWYGSLHKRSKCLDQLKFTASYRYGCSEDVDHPKMLTRAARVGVCRCLRSGNDYPRPLFRRGFQRVKITCFKAPSPLVIRLHLMRRIRCGARTDAHHTLAQVTLRYIVRDDMLREHHNHSKPARKPLIPHLCGQFNAFSHIQWLARTVHPF
jgi:hypothetical protein